MNKIVILTSHGLFHWKSMQQIVPSIVGDWKNLSPQKNQIDLVNVQKKISKSQIGKLKGSDFIVAVGLTREIIEILKYIRKNINPSATYIFYIHNQVNEALFRMISWGEGMYQHRDIFICSCLAEERALRLTFPNARTIVLPFSLPISKTTPTKKIKWPSKKVNFVYVGRVSAQKNLHTLLTAFYIIKKQHSDLNWSLKIVGPEDNLGTKILGIKQRKYKDYLKRIIKKMELSFEVVFLGNKPQNYIKSLMKNKNLIFVSPSLHLDEAFGVAIGNALFSDHICVLSNWGGHQDFIKKFKDQTLGIPVHTTTWGPELDPIEVKKSLLKSIKLKEKFSFFNFAPLKENRTKSNTEIIQKFLSEKGNSSISALIATPHSKKIHAQAKSNMDAGKQNVFSGYGDPLLVPFLITYGMGPRKKNRSFNRKQYLAPWVSVKKSRVIIQDPRRGQKNLEINVTTSKKKEICNIWSKKFGLTHDVLHELESLGLVFPLA